MEKIKISVVSYLNSSPFIFGINHSEIKNEIELSLDIPAVCAEKLLTGKVDVGLVPVAVIPKLKEAHIITDFCIGAIGKVNSVLLLSDVPLEEIKTVLLDYQSRTSVQLAIILCTEHWHITPDFKNAYVNYEQDIKNNTGGLVIGDRALLLRSNFKYAYDLAEAWQQLTQLPFTFACWVSNKKLNDDFITRFNSALKFGLDNIKTVVKENSAIQLSEEVKLEYLEKNISFSFDDEKKKGMKLFLEYLAKAELF